MLHGLFLLDIEIEKTLQLFCRPGNNNCYETRSQHILVSPPRPVLGWARYLYINTLYYKESSIATRLPYVDIKEQYTLASSLLLLYIHIHDGK